MKIVKSSCSSKRKVRTCTFSPQVNIKNKRTAVQTEQDVNAAHSEAKLQDLINDIKSNIYTKVKAVATSPEFGFDENEVDDYFFVETSATEIGEDHHEAIRVEVRGEVSYEGLEDLMEALNPIIESYDSYAYFEPVEPGIIEAYVSVDQVDMSIYGATAFPDHMFYDYHGKRFSVHDNSSELRDDVIEDVYYLWKASISQQAGAYNDADEDYVYAFIRGRGVVEYYKKGKYVATSNYNLRDEDDFEQAWEYMEIILQDVCDRLIAYNKDVPDRMIYNSTSVEASEDLTDLPEDFQHAYTLAKNDFMNDYKNAHVNVQIDPDDPYAEEGEISVYLSGFNPYGKKCARHIYINDSLDSDTIYQALKSTAEDVGIRKGHYDINSSTSVYSSGDLSMYSKQFHDAYTSAYIDFKERYPQVEVSEIYDDPSSDDNEICIEICDTNSGNCGKLYLNTQDEFVDSDYILRSFEETAEAIGLLEDNTVYSSVESSDYESDSGIFIEDIIDSLEDNGYDLSRIRSIRQGLLELFGYKGKDADIIIHDLVAGRFIDPNDWVDKDYTPGIYSATDDGEGYWFFTTHGVQPGSVPRDVDILDIIDTPNGSFVKFDRFLSTKELNEYDMVEKAPKSVMSAEADELRSEDDHWVQEIEWAMSDLPSWFKVKGDNLHYKVTYNNQTVDVEFSVYDIAKYTYYINGDGPYTTNQAERIGEDIENYIDGTDVDDIFSDTEEDEEDLPMVDQEYDSAATSINSSKLPAIYKMINLEPGGLYVDFGGGRWDNAVEYIKDKGATLVVYDPYNRSAEHNREVLRILRENGGADAAVNSNVLNVIKEPEARKNVLENIARITKPGAPIYITVYEGKGDGQEGPTKSGYQLNRKTADYLEEIQEVFPDATRKGKLIIAHNSGVSAATNTANIGAKVTCSDDYKEEWIKLAKKQVLDSDGFYTDYTMYVNEDGTSYIFMFGDEDMYEPDPQYADYECSDWDEASEWWNDYNGFEDENLEDVYSSDSIGNHMIITVNSGISGDGFSITVEDEQGDVVFNEVYRFGVNTSYDKKYAKIAEEDYHNAKKYGWSRIPELKPYVGDIIDNICNEYNIQKKDIVFKRGNNVFKGSEVTDRVVNDFIDSYINASYSIKGSFSDLEDEYLSPPEYDDPIEHEDSEELVEVEINQIITVDVDGDYEWDDDTYVWASPDESNEEWRSEDGVYIDDKVGVVEHIDDLIIPNVPTRPGKYRVTGLAELIYDVSGIQEYRTNYGPDDYESDLDTDHAIVSFNFRKSEVQNLKITPVRR